MSLIPFTQLLQPDGRPVRVSIERPDDVVEKAKAILRAGFRFECEVLTTGEVSLTITDDDADWAVEVVPNGPEVPAAVDRLITEFVDRHSAEVGV